MGLEGELVSMAVSIRGLCGRHILVRRSASMRYSYGSQGPRRAISRRAQETSSEGGSSGLGDVARRAFGFSWPLLLLFAATKSAPIGVVADKRTDEDYRKELSDAEYAVLRGRGTERAFSSPLYQEKRAGTYNCRACGSSLFSSATKFDSGTGWPSFYDFIADSVDLTIQPLYNLTGDIGARECRCHRCGSHLGHVFTDGAIWNVPASQATGKPSRYCMNGVALDFKPEES